jgi:cytochrome c2
MYRHLIHALTCLTVIGAGLATGMIRTSSQGFGDAKRGATLARGLCSECHAVTPGEQSSNQAAPTFERIAGTAGMVGLALEAALNSTHRQMPNVMLSASDRADIIAYIESLREGK